MLRTILALITLTAFTGCGSYSIRGRVVEGDGGNMVVFVSPGDASLEIGSGVSGAQISAYRDPGTLNRRVIATTRSGPDGWFTLPLDNFGAGWMDETWEIHGTAPGHQHSEAILRLPKAGNGMVLLIILPRGPDPRDPRDDSFLDDFERFK